MTPLHASPRTRRSIVLALVVGLAVVPAASSGARELEVPEVLDSLQRWLDGTRDLNGRFDQALVSGAFGSGIEESGRIYLERPGRMRWDYLDPERKVALLEGGRTRFYVEEDGQLWEGRLGDSDGLLLILLAGKDPLRDLFHASLQATPTTGGEGGYVLRLVPRASEDSVQEVLLRVRPPKFAIEAANVLDGAGNQVEYRFSSMRRNRGLPEGIFDFEPPPGTEIVSGP